MTEPDLARGRFAPSPTGPLHRGSLVAALASYLLVKSQKGQWLVRVEDLDPPREIPGMAERQIQQLAGFGLHSDLPVVQQSQRHGLYEQALARLLAEDKAFLCSCSRTQLAETQGTHRHCVAPVDEKHAAVRLKVPDIECRFHDALQGPQVQALAREVGDFVLKRADGLYAYQLAVVVDDALQGITQVVRGADLLDSTARQIFLQQQLGLPTPDYWHVNLVLDATGQKLSKSDGEQALNENSRFEELQRAYRHLGQDADVLDAKSDIPENLGRALRGFDLSRLLAASAL